KASARISKNLPSFQLKRLKMPKFSEGWNGPLSLRGPFQPSENFGIFKRFSWKEGKFFEIRADAFNAFNRSGNGDPDTNLGDPTFGQILDVQQGSRHIQVAGRITF